MTFNAVDLATIAAHSAPPRTSRAHWCRAHDPAQSGTRIFCTLGTSSRQKVYSAALADKPTRAPTLTGIKSAACQTELSRFQGLEQVSTGDHPPSVEPDDECQRLAARAMQGAKFGASGCSIRPSGAPWSSPIAVAQDEAGQPLTLISELAPSHEGVCARNAAASASSGRAGSKGHPLTHTAQLPAR